MPTSTYDLIASNVLSSSASSVTFSSIPATYRDLIVVIEAKTSALAYGDVVINGDTGANYSYVAMDANGTTAISFTGGRAYIGFEYARFSTDANISIGHFLDYSATDKHKTYLVRGNRASGGVGALAARWASTSAITSLEFSPTTGTFSSGSTFYLYGIVS